ncbi:MAG: dihydrolipoyllysine-residue succinyltransferase, partial [Bacteroidetes bacterium]|nr:dihydrolipoyllysine-residue succinyltransferase [Bacteroidota bacterium]
MAIKDVKVPSPGESITEVEIANWVKADGDWVEKDEVIGEIDSDKATLELVAEEAGAVKILVPAGTTVKVGAVVCQIDTAAAKPAGAAPKKEAALAAVEERVAAGASRSDAIRSIAAEWGLERRRLWAAAHEDATEG